MENDNQQPDPNQRDTGADENPQQHQPESSTEQKD